MLSTCIEASFSPASSCRALRVSKNGSRSNALDLRDEASAAAWNLAEELAAAGDFTAAANWARKGVDLAPFREAAFRRFLALLDRSGDRAAAAHAYAKFADDIARELDVSPSAETRLLIGTIKAKATEAHETNAVGGVATAQRDERRALERRLTLRRMRLRRDGARRRARSSLAELLWRCSLSSVSVLISTRERPVDASRVEVARWVNRTGDPAFDRIGVVAAERINAAIRKTAVVKDSHLAGAPSNKRAAIVVTGDFSRVGNTLQFHVSITDVLRAGKPWSLAPITARVEAPDQAIDSARPRVIGAIAALRHPMHAALFPLATPPPTYEAYQEFLEGMTLQSQERIIDALAKYRYRRRDR